MASEEIKKIMEKRVSLSQEIEKIDKFLELYKDLTGTNPERIEPAVENSVTHATDSLRGRRKRLPGTVSPADVIPMVRRVLLELARPMTRSELLEELEKRDVRLAGEDKARYLGTILWRAKEEFTNIEGHGYWPSDVACKGVGYSYHPGTVFAVDKDGNLLHEIKTEDGS